MATRFLRLDLAEDSTDYEPFAIRPGLALLDRERANYRALNRRLGRLVGEPEWEGDCVSFFVSDETGARHHNIQCEPVTAKDLSGVRALREDFEAIKSKLQDAGANSRDASVLAAARAHLEESTRGNEFGHHLFRYRDDGGKWRLVWAWGYQRRDQAPGNPKICTNPTCRQLFVRRHSGARDCPGCAGERANSKPKPLLRMLIPLLVLIACGAGWYASRFLNKPGAPVPGDAKLVVQPADWKSPAGGQREYRVILSSGDEASDEDVTARVISISDDPKVARFEKGTTTLVGRAAGKTAIHFYLGDEVTHATVEIEAPRNPASIRLEPQDVTLGIGSTEQLRLLGDYGDGQLIDLTEMAQWEPIDDATVSCNMGRLEGISTGDATIAAKFQATPEDPLLSAQATIRVADQEYSSLEIAIDPGTLREGTSALVAVSLVGAGGELQNAMGSSSLSLSVVDSTLAVLEGDRLHALRSGTGKLLASFGNLTAETPFTVQPDLSGRFVVTPRELQLYVGEVVELDVVSGSSEAIHIQSSSPQTVALESGTSVVGKAPGKAVLTVTQEAREVKVEVEVKHPDLKSLAFVPARISVPVDRTVPVRLVGLTNDDKRFDLSPEAVTWERMPTTSIAELDVEKMQILGRTPTDVPEQLTVRAGGVRASGQVDVVAGPLRLLITPSGPLELRKGQSAQVQAWVRYGDGTRAQVDPQRLTWRTSPEDSRSIVFDRATGTVVVVEEGGSLSVSAMYQGYTSNRITYSTLSEKFSLRLDKDRPVLLVGDRGRFNATVLGSPPGLALQGARFESKDASRLAIDRNTGQYHALAPGKVFVGVQHPNATNAAVENIEIRPREEATLLIRPADIKLLVDGRREIMAAIVTDTQEGGVSLSSGAPGTTVSIGQPNAVHWQPPMLTGRQTSTPFEIVIEHEGKVARAIVQVLPEGGDLRITPDHARLSPGQDLSPVVQQQIPGTDEWLELDPGKITWEVPDDVRWTPARHTLRPRISPAPTAQGTLTLTANYRGKRAPLQLEVANDGPPSGDLEVAREPDREELSVGDQQQFAIMVRIGAARSPASGVQWQEPFENDFVRWTPPVLIAKRAGHEQLLHASVGNQEISFATRTVVQPPAPMAPPPPADKPVALRLVADQTQPITLPVGSQFSTFRVEADYPSRPPVDVTGECLFETSPGPQVTFRRGAVWAHQAGPASLSATFNGARTTNPLSLNVVDDLDLTDLVVVPAQLQLKVGESATLEPTGFVGQADQRVSVGQIASLESVRFQSEQPNVVRADGPTLTGVSPGNTKVVVHAGDLQANVDVQVVPEEDAYDQPLDVTPRSIRLSVGESKLLGPDIVVRRGEGDVSDQVTAQSSDPDTIRFNPSDRSFAGVSPGHGSLRLQAGGQSVELPVLVVPANTEEDATLVVEPESCTIAVGQTVPLRAVLVDSAGRRVDRTSSAVWHVDPSGLVAMQHNRMTGIAVGDASIGVKIPGVSSEANSQVTVVADEYTSLEVSPSPLLLALGQSKPIQVQAVGPSGRLSLGDHPDLKVEVSGSNPSAVDMSGNQHVRGATPGSARLQISWQNLQAEPVDVVVEDQPLQGLKIVPQSASVEVNGREPVQVLAMRGGSDVPVTEEDGLTLSVDDPSIAELTSGSIRGIQPGNTSVTARLGSLRAAGRITVSPDSGRDRAADMPIGLRFIPDVLRIQLGVPGGSVRLVKVSQGGTVEDLDHRADFEITTDEGKEVVSVKWTASGPVFVAKKVGEADVQATAGNLTTARPLRVVVIDPSQQPQQPQQTRLQVQPDPLRMKVGEEREFSGVMLIPGNGSPQSVAYSATSNNNSVLTAEGRTLRGVSTGQVRVTVRPIDVPDEFAGASADVSVFVEAEPPPTPEGAKLVLKGPSRGTIGEPLKFHVTLEGPSSEQDVTHDGASLVLSADQSPMAGIAAGCELTPSQAGILRVKARYKDQVSNALPVSIDPQAEKFVKLELEIESRPMSVGERRSYRVWGYPSSRGPRQDLTHRCDQEGGPRVGIAGRPGNEVFTHETPSLIANAAGMIRIAAQHGDLRSEISEIEVMENESGDLRLRAEPPTMTIRVGEQTPPIKIFAEASGRDSMPVEVEWSNDNETVLGADPNTKGRFLGRQVGEARLTATFADRTATVLVRVASEPFQNVAINEKPDFQPGNRFSVIISVESATASGESFEYRVSTVGDPDSGQWNPGQEAFEISSPALKRGPDDTTYHLILEARPPRGQVVAKYPLSFSLNPTIQSHSVVEEKP